MHRHLAPLLLTAALTLSSCAAQPLEASPTPSPPATSASPTASADSGPEQFLRDVRMKARTLTADTIDDEALLALGAVACEAAGDEGARDMQLLNARLNMGYSGEEARTVFETAERWLC